MSEEITSGTWFNVATEDQHDSLKSYGTLNQKANKWMANRQLGRWQGPGWYMLRQYQGGSPCYDDINKVCSAREVAEEARELMRDLADVLKDAKNYSQKEEQK